MTKEKEKIKKDDYQKALSDYTQAIKALNKRDYERARELFKAFLEKHASERELADRVRIYLKVCQKQKKVEKIQLKTFNDYYQYSVQKINKGDYEEALKLLGKAREMKPREGKILYLTADAYCLMGETEKCLEHLKKATQMDDFFRTLAQNERDFEPIWEDKKFILITRMV